MERTALPSIFVSHGSPTIALEPGRAGAFLKRLGPAIDAAFGRPRAIVAVSAHTLARSNAVLAGARHEAVHDFGGFPEALYRLRYDAPGDPALGRAVGERLAAAGFDAPVLDASGLDHGIWTALIHAYPDAAVPVVPVAMRPMDSPARQMELGAALAPLRDDGVLVFATGSMTHDLRRVFAGGRLEGSGDEVPEQPANLAFREWFAERAGARDWDALADYRRLAPHAAEMHPTDEHLLPFHVAAGAGGREARPERLYSGAAFGWLAMDAWAFGEGAQRLARALA